MYLKVRGVAPQDANSDIQYMSDVILRRSSDFDEHRDRMSTDDNIQYSRHPRPYELWSRNWLTIELEITSDLYGIMARQPVAARFPVRRPGHPRPPDSRNNKIFFEDMRFMVEKDDICVL